MIIRPATEADRDMIASIMSPIVRAGETYTLPRDMSRTVMADYWLQPGHSVFVAEENGEILGTAYLRANQAGGGDHVANAGFMTAPAASGRGIARQLCAYVLDTAKARGFRAMQFNFVVSTNIRAIKLWESLGFRILCAIPEAFRHPSLDYVDALVMYRRI